MTSDVDAIVRPFALGLATGSRATAGVTAVALFSGANSGPVGRLLGSTWAKRALPVLCAGELVGDKLPKTPSRLEPGGFPIRLINSALTGIAVAERDGTDQVATAGLAVAGAGLGAVLGAGLRGVARSRGWTDLPVALGEDLLAALFAFIGVAAARDHG